MTKQEAYKKFRCWHCVYCDHDEGVCLCGDPESDECQKDDKEDERGRWLSERPDTEAKGVCR